MPHLLGPEQERRLISVLAVDLVGFAAAAQVLDVEDLHVAQREFFSLVAAAVLNADGTIAKRIGDAVVAVFGVPTAHENDPYRAVWAGLEIQAALAAGLLPDGRPMAARAGVVTGEALVFYEPGRDDPRVAGKVLSQAMAVQAAAPVGTVVVGAHTHRSTHAQVDYAPLPVPGHPQADTWRALGVKARPGQVADALPMVGREPELQLLVSGARRAMQERRGQVVTLVGTAGLGKSRLTRALAEHLDSPVTPTMVRWRVGQCPSYGEGVTYGALVQIVKAQAAILDSDSGSVARDKLDASVDGLLRSATPDVLAQTKERLAALLGLPGVRNDLTETVAAGQAAWCRYLLALAEDAPTVLVLEDLHWADDAFLDFLRSVVDGATTVPLLVVGTARPELLERRADWVTGSGDAITITLTPLTDGEMVDLMAQILGPSALPEGLQRRLLDLVGGVPLYAEEYVRMLGDSGALAEGVQELLADLPLPDNRAGRARLPARPADRR